MSENSFLVGVRSGRITRDEADESLSELARLARTAGAHVVGSVLLDVRRATPATLLGSGQVEEIRQLIIKASKELASPTVLIDGDLSPAQYRNLEEAWGAKVIDRTGLILDIFARRAHTQEGRLQVELAQMRYLLPRLVGHGNQFSQLGGGIGTRGPGETKLEFDRRKVRLRITLLRRELSKVHAHREIHRARRRKIPVPVVSVVGYTNAGKSTLVNAITGAGTATEDKLFVTLDPLTRRFKLPSGREIVLTDTVGFIGRLPHQLVESFHATFEEIREASLILHVIDYSHPRWREQCDVTLKLLEELQLDTTPRLVLYNKIDLIDDGLDMAPGAIGISAATGKGLDALIARIENLLAEALVEAKFLVPYDRGDIVSTLYSVGSVRQTKYLQQGVRIQAWIPVKYREKYKGFV